MSARKKSNTSKKNKIVDQAPLENIEVKLKPVLGVQPRAYVPLLWGLIIAGAVFLLLVLPGLRQNGTNITFRSLPPDASVIVDGIRLGATGETVFVAKGTRDLTIQRVGFIPLEIEIEVGGRVFASRLFPRKDQLAFSLQPDPDFDHMAYGTSEFAAWTATGPERSRYAIPPVLTITARDILNAGYNSEDDMVSAVLPLAIDERHLADIMRAQYLLETSGAAPGVRSLIEFIDYLAVESTNSKQKPQAILKLLSEERLAKIGVEIGSFEETDDLAKLVNEAGNVYSSARASSSFPTRFVGNMLFVSIPQITLPIGDLEVVAGGYFPRSGALPVLAAVGPYSISTLEVSNDDFAAFILENPDWSVENRDRLVGENLVDDDYLSSWSISGPSPGSGRDPVSSVSWFAAAAFTEWFSSRYLTGTKTVARLPLEDEWEIAARLNGAVENTAELPAGLKSADSADTGILGIRGMAGNVREWCLNPYRVNENLFRPADGRPSYQQNNDSLAVPEHPVRGGAHIDGNLPFPAAVRGGLQPVITSPVIGFRLVIAPVQ